SGTGRWARYRRFPQPGRFRIRRAQFPHHRRRRRASRPGIGDWKWSVGAQYRVGLGAAGSLTPRADGHYTPGYCGHFARDSIGQVDSYTLVNARLAYRTADEDWSIALEGTNLFDKLYYLNKIVPGFYATGQPGRPREVALTVRRQF